MQEQNIELSISLLDHRFLCGEKALFEGLSSGLKVYFGKQQATLRGHLAWMARARHAKFQNTIYHLEPDVKEGPGGLPDGPRPGDGTREGSLE